MSPKNKNRVIGVSVMTLASILVVCLIIKDVYVPEEDRKREQFFASFGEFNGSHAKFRVGLCPDSAFHHVYVRALTTAHFDSIHFNPSTIFILEHEAGDSIVVESSEYSLLSHEQFANFYYANKDREKADTLVDASYLDRFYIVPEDKIDVEQISDLPFLFMDVGFKGYPALLVRHTIGDYFYRFKVYGITESGFKEVSLAPYNAIKSRTNQWCFGGATEFNYNNKTITVSSLAPGSCSDYGTQIIDVYKLNEKTEKFDIQRQKINYNHCY